MHSPSTLNAMGPWEVISSPSTNHTSSPPSRDSAYNAYIQQHSASTINTESVVLTALRQQYPEAHITNMPAFVAGLPTVIDLIQYASDASTGAHAELIENADSVPTTLSRRNFMPPSRQLDGDDGGNFISQVIFGRYRYEWRGRTWLLFYVTCHNTPSYPLEFKAHFLVSGKGVEFPDGSKASGEGEVKDLLQLCDDQLIRSATMWANALHESIWVFNNGFWSQDHELYKNIMKADWGDVILDDKRKQTLQNDVARFFDGRERYQRLRVPWKRGVIYYGPPGNGKTISIKATMHSLYQRSPPVPTLYVRTLTNFYGPEWAVSQIFGKARSSAPCLLVFEDLDSVVTPAVRSFFLNEVDGLTANDGIMMIGSTNHLELLDPGISKRPSRFDRKFLFDRPNVEQRTKYAEYWRRKLSKKTLEEQSRNQSLADLSLEDMGDDNQKIEFPEGLCPKIAGITDGFSFAYMQEAFVASLLAIAAEDGAAAENTTDDEFDHLRLWKELKKQIRALREEMLLRDARSMLGN